MHWIGWCIVLVPLAFVLGMAFYASRFVRGVADYLAAGRVAGRYIISVGDLQSGLGVITLVALVEQQYQSGLALGFWTSLMVPITLVVSLTGYCVYRFRETRALSMGQFLEMRYSRSFRISAAAVRTIAEMLTNAIGPAVAARFFIYYLGLPHQFAIGPVVLPTFAVVMAVVLVLALAVIWPGGRVSLIVTDCIQGLMAYPIFVIFTVWVLSEFSFAREMAPAMLDRAPGESHLNPFDISKLRDFNLFAIFVTLFGSILNRASWIGNDTSGSARNPHEQKMAGILGTWRNGFSLVMCILIAATVYTVMNHARFAPQAKTIRVGLVERVAGEVVPDADARERAVQVAAALPGDPHIIGVDPPLSRDLNTDTPYLQAVHGVLGDTPQGNATFQQFKTLYHQMMLPLTLREMLPTVLIGLFALLMVMLMLTTDDSRILNASATIIQDIVMPLRKRPFTTGEHFLWLRLCTLGVCLFFFFVSLYLSQLDYINMFLTIMVSIWLGAAGPIMVFGLYTRFGTTAGAWASLVLGSGLSVAGILLQQHWAGTVYPWLDACGWVAPLDAFLRFVSGPFDPYIVWEMSPLKFPINSAEISFIAMLSGIVGYVAVSLATRKEPYNLDRMLHRGRYAVAGDGAAAPEAFSWKTLYDRLIGITPECTRGDKIIIWTVLVFSLGYQFLIAFVGVVLWNANWPISGEGWTSYFFITNVVVAVIIGVASTVWFFVGGVIDMRRLFRDLKARVDNPLDDGWVDGQVSRVDQTPPPDGPDNE